MSLIIGYGNPLRSDDAIGQVIAQALGGINTPQLSPELADPISQADFVIFIDACYGERAGEIDSERIEAETEMEMSHQSSPASLLAAAKDLYGTTPPALLISIAGASFDYGDTLSPQLQALLPSLIEQVQTIIGIHDKA